MTEPNFKHTEMRLLYLALNRVQALKAGAQRHLKEGFARRVLLIQSNRRRMLDISYDGRTSILSIDECSELNVHLNSFYVQLRGALDNLAWALHYEFELFGSVDEDTTDIRPKCQLFDNRFLAKLAPKASALEVQLRAAISWASDFKELRDPVAHRIPLYAVPGVAFPADAARIQQLYDQSSEAAKNGDIESSLAKIREAGEIGGYQPLFVTSGPQGLQIRNVRGTIVRDQQQFLDIAGFLLQGLGVTET